MICHSLSGANQVVTACLDTDLSGLCDGSETPVTYIYDAYGNLIYDGELLHTYDAANRLMQVCESTNGTSCTGVTTTYTYNGNGDRIAQEVVGSGVTITTTYILDTAVSLTMVLAETTTIDDGINPTTTQPTITYLHGLGLVAQRSGTTTEYFTYDGLGSVRQVVNDSSEVLLGQTFDPYGSPYEHAVASVWTGDTSYGFTNEYTDSIGLLYLRARYYDPKLGRFFQPDPSRQESNPYRYANSNPVMFTDPSGLCYSQYSIPAYIACLEQVLRIEATYEVTIYWPDRPALDLLALGCTSDWAAEPTPDLGGGFKLKPWSHSELNALEEGLAILTGGLNTLGIGAKELTEGGVIFRVNHNSTQNSPSNYCHEGLCNLDPTIPNPLDVFEGAAYSIAFTDLWTSQEKAFKQYMVLHEYGHRGNWLLILQPHLAQ